MIKNMLIIDGLKQIQLLMKIFLRKKQIQKLKERLKKVYIINIEIK